MNYREISTEEKNELGEKGFLLIENVLSPTECDYYIRKLNELYVTYGGRYAQGSNSVRLFHREDDAQIKMVYNLYNKDLKFMDLIEHERIIPYISHMLREGSYGNSEAFVLQLSTGRSVGGGSEAQQLHIDSKVPGCPYALAAQALWLLTDFTE